MIPRPFNGTGIKPDRRVERVFLHCSASEIALEGASLVDEIDRWHRARGFSQIGYHWIIDRFGVIWNGRPIDLIPAAQRGHNDRTLAICAHGLETFPEAQLSAVADLCRRINNTYSGRISFHGHREVNPHKTCPVFNYRGLLALDRWNRMP